VHGRFGPEFFTLPGNLYGLVYIIRCSGRDGIDFFLRGGIQNINGFVSRCVNGFSSDKHLHGDPSL
jgi:hypothetical protein